MDNIIFSGMQPTGNLHIGNYLGALAHWVKLQEKYNSFFCIVDYHAITINYEPKEMQKRIINLTIDYLSCGIDPKKSTIFIQSQIPEHTELAWIFNSITQLGELERMTQFKEKAEQNKKNINAGLLTYPILQAADVLLYKANIVPVGEDQIQHVELMRDIARKFNKLFGKTFQEPKHLLTKTPRIMSLANPVKKMSKSLGEKNYIALSDNPKTIQKKVRSAVTETETGGKSPGVLNLLSILEAFDENIAKQFILENQKKTLKYKDLKEILSNTIISHLLPIQEKRQEIENNQDYVAQILIEGALKARKKAKETMNEIRKKIGIR
jgi:tryptophanyl-tRNA synthetase